MGSSSSLSRVPCKKVFLHHHNRHGKFVLRLQIFVTLFSYSAFKEFHLLLLNVFISGLIAWKHCPITRNFCSFDRHKTVWLSFWLHLFFFQNFRHVLFFIWFYGYWFCCWTINFSQLLIRQQRFKMFIFDRYIQLTFPSFLFIQIWITVLSKLFIHLIKKLLLSLGHLVFLSHYTRVKLPSQTL
jgi:hypothetical protein